MEINQHCLACDKPIEGRMDKLFCDVHCKSSYHYKKNRAENLTLFKQIDLQLKQNRKLLKHFNQAGKATIRKETLLNAGFDPKYFTHYWKNKKGDIYLFCYDYGYLSKTENGHSKYILVQWQDYME